MVMSWQAASLLLLGGSTVLLLMGMPVAISFVAINIVGAILFLGGVQLLCIGILGEYVGRIYQNVKGRPLTVIGESVGMDEQTRLRTITAA